MIRELEEYARINNVPIMLPDGIEYLCNYIKEHKIKNILEIGTAIGYSSIRMSLIDKEIKVTTIERDEERYKIAVDNIKKFGLEQQITPILGDAMDVSVDGSYDLIFIDASKGHSIDFFNKYKDNLVSDGVIITDNLSFHGLVEDDSLAVTKNQKGLVKRIKKFIEFLDNNEEFITTYVPVGDRISITVRNNL